MAEVRLRGSCVTPGENSARSENRRPLSGKIVDRAFVEQGGDRAGLGFDEHGRGGYGRAFLRSGHLEAEFEFGGAADVNMQLRRDLGRHALRYHASGVVARRQQVEGEAAFAVRSRGVPGPSRGVYDDHRRLSHASAGRIEHRAA